MNEDEIRKILEESDPEGKIPPRQIEDIIAAVKEVRNIFKNEKEVDNLEDNFAEIRIRKQIEDETDWRKKAALAARNISNKIK